MSTKFYNVKEEPFAVCGLYNVKNEKPFKRLPDDVAAATSKLVDLFHTNTAGGRVRFRTDSGFVTLKVRMPKVLFLPHMSLTGTSGFDLYADEGAGSTFCQIFRPPQDEIGGVLLPFSEEYESTIQFNDSRFRDITINFPLYNDVDDVQIGLDPAASAGKSPEYRHPKPIVFYGSSITQGACATRPGSCYTSILSRRLDSDHINLGFGGSALGEDAIVDYIASLDASVFVCDYDHNAPDVRHLSETHARLYRRYRAVNPGVPVVFLTKPDFDANKPVNAERRAVIRATYDEAVKNGDRNVYFIDGETFFGDRDRDACTADSTHPNDLGFMRMADTIEGTLRSILPGR